MNRPIVKMDEKERKEIPLPETDWSVADYYFQAGSVVCRKHPSAITFEKAKDFFRDPEFQSAIEGYDAFIVGKFLWVDWTFDLDIVVYFEELNPEKIQSSLETIYNLAVNKKNILIDASFIDQNRSSYELPQKSEIIEYNKDLNLPEEEWIYPNVRTLHRLEPMISEYKGWNPIPKELRYSEAIRHEAFQAYDYQKIHENLISVKSKWHAKKIIKHILNSKKENLVHRLKIEEFLNMTETEFIEFRNY